MGIPGSGSVLSQSEHCDGGKDACRSKGDKAAESKRWHVSPVLETAEAVLGGMAFRVELPVLWVLDLLALPGGDAPVNPSLPILQDFVRPLGILTTTHERHRRRRHVEERFPDSCSMPPNTRVSSTWTRQFNRAQLHASRQLAEDKDLESNQDRRECIGHGATDVLL